MLNSIKESSRIAAGKLVCMRKESIARVSAARAHGSVLRFMDCANCATSSAHVNGAQIIHLRGVADIRNHVYTVQVQQYLGENICGARMLPGLHLRQRSCDSHMYALPVE